MKTEQELQKEHDEIRRKVGRNVLLFQQMEFMLKHIISEWEVSGFSSEILANKAKKKRIVDKQTMGQLVAQFLDNTFSEYQAPEIDTVNKKEMHFDFKINIPCENDFYEEKKRALSEIVRSRNELIHHFLSNFSLDSIGSCLEAEKYIDEQHDKFIPEHRALKKLILAVEQEKSNLLKYLQSDSFKKDFKLSRIRQSPLVTLLAEISSRNARPDGWTLLGVAGKIAHSEEPDEIESISVKYGFKKLKELLMATDIFDLYEEPTDRGGIRVLYRLKAGWELSPE